jgi:dihydropteroate synthase
MPRTWTTNRRTFEIGDRALLMGILNITPDSFSDGGRYITPETALEHAAEMLEAGADILDIGGESTRPGAGAVPLDEELRRVIPAIEAITTRFPECAISIDTSKSEVARRAIAAGAEIINDVTALRGDPGMAHVCSETRAGVVLMHMLGTPRTMQINPEYSDVVADVRTFFEDRRTFAIGAGILDNAMVFDPGIGFGKTIEHNLELLAATDALRIMDRPILVGFSRKSFIGRILGTDDMEDRKWPSVALTSYVRERGADIIRVHDVRECHDAVRVTEAVMASGISENETGLTF